MLATHLAISTHCHHPVQIPRKNICTLLYQLPHRRSITLKFLMPATGSQLNRTLAFARLRLEIRAILD